MNEHQEVWSLIGFFVVIVLLISLLTGIMLGWGFMGIVAFIGGGSLGAIGIVSSITIWILNNRKG